jgi:hypothetical protein
MRRRTPELYLQLPILAAFACLPVLYLVAYLPAYATGSANIIIQGYYMHVVLGLWFTPLILGITYWALPILLNKPIYSYGLGVLAFWGNLVFYSLIGAHHFIFARRHGGCNRPPYWSACMLVPVGHRRGISSPCGSWRFMRHELPVALLAGALMYGLASTRHRASLQAGQTHRAFPNYTVGHAHFAAYGFVSFLAFGAIYALLPRAVGRSIRPSLVALHFWLALLGLALYVVAMTAGGLLQGLSWAGRGLIDSVTLSAPLALVRHRGSLGSSQPFFAEPLVPQAARRRARHGGARSRRMSCFEHFTRGALRFCSSPFHRAPPHRHQLALRSEDDAATIYLADGARHAGAFYLPKAALLRSRWRPALSARSAGHRLPATIRRHAAASNAAHRPDLQRSRAPADTPGTLSPLQSAQHGAGFDYACLSRFFDYDKADAPTGAPR